MCVEYPQVCEKCIERYTNLKFTLRKRFLSECSTEEIASLTTDTIREVCGEISDLLNIDIQSKDEYWCDIDGIRVKYTRKEYERQIQPKQVFEPTSKTKKPLSKRKLSSVFKRLSKSKVYIQSQEAKESGAGASDTTTAENVIFHDEAQGQVLDYVAPLDDSMFEDMMPAVELAEFLSRPVLIDTFTYAMSDPVGIGTSIFPWHLFFNSTPIKKKLDNYSFINCTLKIKVVVNSSPFYYGSVLVNYQPLYYDGTSEISTDAAKGELIPMSQRPHIWVYPQTNQGGEMSLPFFYNRNWLNATSANDLVRMGRLTYVNYAPLLSANGATGASLKIQVYAWAENVKLMGPTIKLAVQSSDEYGTGPISKLSSAVATATGALSNAPVIGRYMRASSIIATATGQVAHLFGFTNVPNINNTMSVKSSPFPQLASPEISTPVEKLTLDPKNELSIDSRTVGLDGTDELTIKYLCSKESYLLSSTIPLSTAVDAVPITIIVSNMYAQHASGNDPYRMLPLSYVSSYFQYWRGDIHFRFKFICTKYHKGRVRLTYDPIGTISTDANSYSTAFNRVLDIGEDNDVELIVPYMQARPWLKTINTPSYVAYSTSGAGLTNTMGTTNGTLTMRIVTPITAPANVADIRVQVFVKAGENFEVALPIGNPGFGLSIQSQDVMEYSAPTPVVAGTSSGNQHPARYLINMGENITSIRQVMRRSQYSHSVQFPNTVGVDNYESLDYKMSKYPPFYGYDTTSATVAKGILTPGSNFGFNYASSTAYNWFAPMFIGQRGSFIWNFNLDSPVEISSTSISKYPGTIAQGNLGTKTGISSGFSQLARVVMIANRFDAGGISLTNQYTQTGLSALLPQYNPNRFTFVNPVTSLIGTQVDDTDIEIFNYKVSLVPITRSSGFYDQIRVDTYSAIGPDFNLFFWLNCPDLYYLADPSPV